jgi:hypothetical protein
VALLRLMGSRMRDDTHIFEAAFLSHSPPRSYKQPKVRKSGNKSSEFPFKQCLFSHFSQLMAFLEIVKLSGGLIYLVGMRENGNTSIF